MLDGMTVRHLHEWMFFASVEPLPTERLDWQFGHLVSTIWNIMRDTTSHPMAFTPKEGMLKFRDPEDMQFTQTWEEKNRILMMWAMAYGGSRAGIDGRNRND